MNDFDETRQRLMLASLRYTPLRKALHDLRAMSQLSDCDCAPLVARVLDHVQDLMADRNRLRGLVLDLLNAFDAAEDAQVPIKRRARDELAVG